MSYWFATLLGTIQGLTEFLPISSTAHLRIAPALLHRADAGAAFTAVLQLGTLVAVILYFARELLAMLVGVFRDPRGKDGRLALYLVAGTIPIGVAGIAFKQVIVGDARSLWVVASALVGVGVVMWLVDVRAAQRRGEDDLRLRDALLIGCAQACALIPGVSRSGATMTMALALGLRREAAARFSFLLSIPAIGAAGVFELPDAVRELGPQHAWGPLLAGTVVAGLVGFASIVWLLRYLRTRSFLVMVLYRIALGAALFALLAGHRVPA